MVGLNREDIIKSLNTKSFNKNFCIEMLKEYCKDTNKDEKDVVKLIEIINNIPPLLDRAINSIIPYFIRKYEIYSIEKNNNILIFY